MIEFRTSPTFWSVAWVYLYASGRVDARACAVAFTERVAGAISETTSEMSVRRVARLPLQGVGDIQPGRSPGDVYRFKLAIGPAA